MSLWQTAPTTLLRADIDFSMKLVIMETRKNVVKVSPELSVKDSYREKTFLSLPNYGKLTTVRSTSRLPARNHSLTLVSNI